MNARAVAVPDDPRALHVEVRASAADARTQK